MYRYVDVHAHVGMSLFGPDSDGVIRQMREEGVAAISVGVDLTSSREAVACAEAHDNIFATVGLHPMDNCDEVFDERGYDELASHPRVVAIGECGVDYYRTPAEKREEERTRQRGLFRRQVAFAAQHRKPLMVHGRPSRGTLDAYEDILEVLRGHAGSELSGNVHFFVGSAEVARQFFELNFTVSFSGVVTFTSSYDDVVRSVPQSMLHAETDSPFASPVPHRGARNSPLYVPLIVARLAHIRSEPEEVLRRALLENAQRTFGCEL